MSQENRLHPRVKVNWPVTIKTREGPITGVIKDISAGGAFVSGWKRLKPNEESHAPNYHSSTSKLRLLIDAKVIRQDTERLDNETMFLGMGIQFTRLSSEARDIISTLVSTYLKKEAFDAESYLEQPVCEESKMLKEHSQSIKVKIKPSAYPMIKLHWKQQSEYKHDGLETDVLFPRELWENIAKACDKIAHAMGAFNSPKVRKALTLMADRIMAEIDAEDRRLSYKESYESFFDFVDAINNRTDLDRVRKAQLIHEKALQIQLQSQKERNLE